MTKTWARGDGPQEMLFPQKSQDVAILPLEE
jgi:hypothetical protein